MYVLHLLAGFVGHYDGYIIGIAAQFSADLLEIGAPFLMSQFAPMQKRRIAGFKPTLALPPRKLGRR